jgi:hypothetical protein
MNNRWNVNFVEEGEEEEPFNFDQENKLDLPSETIYDSFEVIITILGFLLVMVTMLVGMATIVSWFTN